MAAPIGFEPMITNSESGVLPAKLQGIKEIPVFSLRHREPGNQTIYLGHFTDLFMNFSSRTSFDHLAILSARWYYCLRSDQTLPFHSYIETDGV